MVRTLLGLGGSSTVSMIIDILTWLLLGLGCSQLFAKDKIKKKYAFIPGVVQYELAIMAEREEEGRTFFLLSVCQILTTLMSMMFDSGSNVALLLGVVVLALAMAKKLFSVRIFLALCDVFGKRRRWTWAWVIIPEITSLIWGFSKKFVPKHDRPIDTDFEKAASISGATIDAIREGLTVNLTDRTVINLGKKVHLLKDIHLSIPTGHMVLLLGGSGAGKTTFLNAVTGYEKANAEILLHGKDFYNNYESMKYDLGFVPQQDLMRTSDTVYMTLSDAAKLRLPKSVSSSDRKKRITDVL